MDPGDRTVSKLHLRIAHANQLLRALWADVSRYIDSQPYEIVLQESLDSRTFVWSAKEHKAFPIEWEIVAGDILHNLRSALDSLACELVEAEGREPSTEVGFPICEKARDLPQLIQRRLPHVSADLKKQIFDLHPYKGGNDALYWLHVLNVHDKHGLEFGVTAGLSRVLWNFGDKYTTHVTHSPNTHAFSAPLAPGTELVRFQSDGLIPVELLRDVPKVSFDIVFWEPRIVRYELVRSTLKALIDETERVLDRMIPA